MSADLVRRILAEMVETLVQISRRTVKEVTLRFHRVGSLHLLKNRELVFSSYSLQNSLKPERSSISTEIEVIDTVSAVLSQGQGRSFSVNSSKLSKKSYVTPASRLESHK